MLYNDQLFWLVCKLRNILIVTEEYVKVAPFPCFFSEIFGHYDAQESSMHNIPAVKECVKY